MVLRTLIQRKFYLFGIPVNNCGLELTAEPLFQFDEVGFNMKFILDIQHHTVALLS